MNLILTSDGMTSKKIRKDFINLLDKPIEETKTIIICAVRKKKHIKYVKMIAKELTSIGLIKENIILADIAKKPSKSLLKDIDLIYMCGGNTFYILDRLRKTGFYEPVKKLVKKNKLYIGVSAGSILAAESIEIAGWGSEGDPNDINLKNLNAFNFTKIAIFPHYHNKLKKELITFKKRVSYPIKELRDGEAVIINKNKINKISK